MADEKPKRAVKCQGRFHELRNFLYDNAFPLVLNPSTRHLGPVELGLVWDLASEDVLGASCTHDRRDPYYHNERTDLLRSTPKSNYLSLVPFAESPSFTIDETLVEDYCIEMGATQESARFLRQFANHPSNFFGRILPRTPCEIITPCGKNLKNYSVSANFGIGTVSEGGVSGGGIRSDSPFLLEVYDDANRGERGLAAAIGFWINPDNTMLVSQMQPCKNAKFPEGVHFGVGCLSVAEAAARQMGLSKILMYSARGHPIFKEHPDGWDQYGPEFVCDWDNSAKKMGFDGSRNGHHGKGLR